MRHFLSVFQQIFAFAWAGSFKSANGWAAVVGAIVLYGLVSFRTINDLVVPQGAYGLVYVDALLLPAAWITIFVAKLAYAPFYLIVKKDDRIQILEQQSLSKANAANTAHKALSIDFEPTEFFPRRTVFPAGNARFEIYFCLKNVGNGVLSECTAFISKVGGQAVHYVLQSHISLQKGQYRYINVGDFNETASQPEQEIYNNFVTIHTGIGGYGGRLRLIAPPPAADPMVITINATALECRSEKRRFNVWVESDRRLLMAPID